MVSFGEKQLCPSGPASSGGETGCRVDIGVRDCGGMRRVILADERLLRRTAEQAACYQSLSSEKL